ncbi:pantothenate kinase [Ureibacillus massiliensis 4400831 = CIP 108448 = CCUG 49529]|uniref:Pantothenate kinase n=1 Tax=Ureibacillus massiliensis 4400831 = CIP 108448 = CCUG 49529 TaxID=1211035 RepID=A0A0A3J0E9_9BACL|nr:type II pantothenate kinase [Ureibacillus massiliensis]KGR90494.1 pantothenate kinase [Ureibacillus massiliensis 4400831 = CIP 108448 = CCUG 49529]
MQKVIGIDAGGTLTKLAFINEQNELQYKVFPSNNFSLVKDWIESNPQIEEIGLTGGRTEQLLKVLKTMKSIEYIVEFEATIKGVKYLLEQEGHQLDKSIITNIGTGTSIHYMEGNFHTRVGGTGVGGGTLTGLSTIMTGVSNFTEIVERASLGSRENIDLFVKDIFQGMEAPIEGHLTASNFGNVSIMNNTKLEPNNLLATIQALVGEVITTLSIQFAEQKECEHIIYIGSTLMNNEYLKKVIGNYTILKKHKPIFLSNSGYAGALGALLNKSNQK